MDIMLTHVNESEPLEACGIVGGINGKSSAVYSITNILFSPTRYRMHPEEQLACFNKLDDHGWDIFAIYHSHPKGPAYPSETDISECYYPDVYQLIWSLNHGIWMCKGFIISDSQYKEIDIQVQNT
jgi:proteasome lid subunit RPN8/RPN11